MPIADQTNVIQLKEERSNIKSSAPFRNLKKETAFSFFFGFV